MSSTIQISLEQASDTCTIIYLSGDLTASAEQALDEAYQQACQAGAKTIILHFRQDDYINSAGLGLLLNLAAETRQSEQRLMAVMPMVHFQKIFAAVGLSPRLLTLYDSLDEALRVAEADE